MEKLRPGGYRDYMAAFKLDVPEKYNFAYDFLDARAGEDPARLAMIHVDDAGNRREYSFGFFRDESLKLASALCAKGVKKGDRVAKGDPVAVLEAMKMESEIAAPVDGVISKISVKERSPVQEGDLMMIIKGDQLRDKPAAKPTRNGANSQAPAVAQPLDNTLRAPLPGLVIDVLVKVGDMIDTDSTVLILEAMKMESEIHSTLKGRISKVHVSKGESIQEGDPLIEVEA